jgi:hypothetical protein
LNNHRPSQRPSAPGLALATAFILYCAAAWFSADLAIAVHKPCASDFEGGCGYGKVWAGALSWLAACAAVAMAGCIATFSSAMLRFKSALTLTAAVLACPFIAYVLYGLYQVAPMVVELLR